MEPERIERFSDLRMNAPVRVVDRRYKRIPLFIYHWLNRTFGWRKAWNITWIHYPNPGHVMCRCILREEDGIDD